MKTNTIRLCAVLALVAITAATSAHAVDINTAAGSANEQLSSSKTGIVMICGSVLSLIGLVYTAVHIGGYMKSHQIDHLFKIGGGIVALAVGLGLIAAF